MFPNFYQIDLHNNTRIVLATSQWNTCKNQPPPLPNLVLSEVHVYEFLNWMYRSFQLCSPLSVEELTLFEDIVQPLLNMCLSDVCSLILTEPHTNQNLGIRFKKSSHLTPIYLNIYRRWTVQRHQTPVPTSAISKRHHNWGIRAQRSARDSCVSRGSLLLKHATCRRRHSNRYLACV